MHARGLLFIQVVVALLLCSANPSPAAAATVKLTSNPNGTVFCDGKEVIFTCETKGSDTLEWRDGFYLGNRNMHIAFVAALHSTNTTRSSSSNDNTVATLTENYLDNGVQVLVSTLRIVPLSTEPSGNVRCVHVDGTEQRIDFQVLAPPMIPQDVVTFQLEHVRDMCAIASVLRSPTNQAQANATTYTVSMDGASVPYRNASLISTDGMKHSTLVYNSSCDTHRISISASNMCGESPGTDEIVLDPDQRFLLSATAFDGARISGGSVVAVIVGVVIVTVKYLLDLS